MQFIEINTEFNTKIITCNLTTLKPDNYEN